MLKRSVRKLFWLMLIVLMALFAACEGGGDDDDDNDDDNEFETSGSLPNDCDMHDGPSIMAIFYDSQGEKIHQHIQHHPDYGNPIVDLWDPLTESKRVKYFRWEDRCVTLWQIQYDGISAPPGKYYLDVNQYMIFTQGDHQLYFEWFIDGECSGTNVEKAVWENYSDVMLLSDSYVIVHDSMFAPDKGEEAYIDISYHLVFNGYDYVDGCFAFAGIIKGSNRSPCEELADELCDLICAECGTDHVACKSCVESDDTEVECTESMEIAAQKAIGNFDKEIYCPDVYHGDDDDTADDDDVSCKETGCPSGFECNAENNCVPIGDDDDDDDDDMDDDDDDYYEICDDACLQQSDMSYNECMKLCCDNYGCDYDDDDGCNKDTDCQFPNAFADCMEGECIINRCASGFRDTNGKKEDGCEYECSETEMESEEVCDRIDNDCDGVVDNVYPKPSADEHCGMCFNECPSNTSCENGECK